MMMAFFVLHAAQHVLRRDLEAWEVVAVGALFGGLAAIVTTPFNVMQTRILTLILCISVWR
jgi:hypothetical protein